MWSCIFQFSFYIYCYHIYFNVTTSVLVCFLFAMQHQFILTQVICISTLHVRFIHFSNAIALHQARHPVSYFTAITYPWKRSTITYDCRFNYWCNSFLFNSQILQIGVLRVTDVGHSRRCGHPFADHCVYVRSLSPSKYLNKALFHVNPTIPDGRLNN